MRRQQRIAYQTKVRLRAPGREHSVVARVQNLSSRGIFVTAADIPEAGTEVRCKLTIAGEPRTLRGRVAWVRPASAAAPLKSPGAGIEFLDLGAEEAELLARLAEPAGEGDRQAVDVWFEGMKAPIRCQAVVVGEGVQLATRLPFMRLNSSVRVSFGSGEDAEVRAGTLETVTLEPGSNDGIPNLQLNVSMPTLDHALGTIEVAGADQAKTPAESALFAQPSTVVDPAVIAPSPEEAAPASTLKGAVFPSVGEVAEAKPAEPPPPPSPPDRERTQRIVMPTRPPLRAPKAPRLAQAFAGRRSWRAAAVGFVGGAVLVGLAVALLAPRGGRPAPAPVKLAAPAPAPAAPGSGVTIEPIAPPEPAPMVIVARKSVTAPAPPPPPASAADEPAATPKAAASGLAVEIKGSTATALLAVSGSLAGAEKYELANPAGLGLKLPRARPRIGLGTHRAAAPFGRLLVQRKGGGSLVRLYFNPKVWASDVRFEHDVVTLALRRK